MGDTINWGIFKRRFWGELLRHQQKVMDHIVSAILGSANRYSALWSLFAILVTLCALLRKFSNWPNVWDITLWDETMYLGVGLINASDLTHGLQHYQESPLYSQFYNLIASLTGAEAPSVFMLGGLSAVLLALFGVAWSLCRLWFVEFKHCINICPLSHPTYSVSRFIFLYLYLRCRVLFVHTVPRALREGGHSCPYLFLSDVCPARIRTWLLPLDCDRVGDIYRAKSARAATA